MTQQKRKRSKLVRFLMSRNQDHFKNTSERRQIIALMFKVAFLEAMALSLILPTVTSTGEIPTTPYQFGTWFNAPNCKDTNATIQSCELMGNQTYRNVIRFDGAEAGIEASLSVGCLVPSNHSNATIALQYANASAITNTNITNFIYVPNAAGGNTLQKVKIDNSANFPCPGNLTSAFQPLPWIQSNPIAFIFRAIILNGGGPGDNPRFSYIGVEIQQYVRNTVAVVATATLAGTSFAFSVFSQYPSASAQAITFYWIATNASDINPACGTGDLCEQNGQGSCTIPIMSTQCGGSVTFTTSFGFKIPEPSVVCQVRGGVTGQILALPSEYLPLLTTQPVTQ